MPDKHPAVAAGITGSSGPDGIEPFGASVNLLRAFVNEVNAQAGKTIASEHARHLVEHAQRVIDALSA